MAGARLLGAGAGGRVLRRLRRRHHQPRTLMLLFCPLPLLLLLLWLRLLGLLPLTLGLGLLPALPSRHCRFAFGGCLGGRLGGAPSLQHNLSINLLGVVGLLKCQQLVNVGLQGEEGTSTSQLGYQGAESAAPDLVDLARCWLLASLP